ncbi:MAG: elongation factor 1-beta [Aigarchaeota archaeon]|nr:elongation factor 1-beta [Aigarchaeota archaeon]
MRWRDVARIVIIMEILPVDQDVDLENLIERIRQNLPEGFELKDVQIRPVAFGLNSIKAIFTGPERDGITRELENYLESFEEIQEVNVTMETRL